MTVVISVSRGGPSFPPLSSDPCCISSMLISTDDMPSECVCVRLYSTSLWTPECVSARGRTSGTTEAEREIAISGCWVQLALLLSIILARVGGRDSPGEVIEGRLTGGAIGGNKVEEVTQNKWRKQLKHKWKLTGKRIRR